MMSLAPMGKTRFGFAYGTLTNHAESGEELFEVFLDPQRADVIYRILAQLSWRKQCSRASVNRSCVRFKRVSDGTPPPR